MPTARPRARVQALIDHVEGGARGVGLVAGPLGTLGDARDDQLQPGVVPVHPVQVDLARQVSGRAAGGGR